MNLHLLAILVLFVGCSQPQIDQSQPMPTKSASEYVHRPAEPEVDKTFMDAQAVEAWRAQITATIEADAAVPHPREIWRYTADFKVDRSRPDPILGDPTVWDAANVVEPGYIVATDRPTPRADEALALEARDEEWSAAEIWIKLNRLDDARRCSAELEKEGEWKAVAMIAVHTGDLAALDRATKRMVDADQVSRTKDVAQYAFSKGKVDVAKHIATSHGWELSEILNPYQIRELALKGDASLLRELIDREIVAWEKGEFSDLPEYQAPTVIVADIAILGQTDKVKAREYAGRYLRLPHANLIVWTECGEGCYSEPVRGTLELYQLIAQEKELRELYFARLRMAIDEMYPVGLATDGDSWDVKVIIAGIEPGDYRGWRAESWQGWEEEVLFTSYLLRVRTMRDAELTAFWVAMLDTFPSRSYVDGTLEFEREVGRCALGLPFKTDLGDPPVQDVILDALSGGTVPSMVDTWAAWDKELPSDERRRGVTWEFTIFTRGEVSPSREAAIRAELGIEQTPGEEMSLTNELEMLFRSSLVAHYGDAWVFKSKFGEAKKALGRNLKAQQIRQDRGMPEIDLYPDSDAEYDELMAPSLALLCEKLPAKCQLWRPTVAPTTP